MSLENYNEMIRNLIFSEDAVTDPNLYHTSSQAETRLEIDENGFLKFSAVPFPSFVSPYLPKLFRTAPYEAALADRILKKKRKFFFLQGGTGCGKSSCFRFLETECNGLVSSEWKERTNLSGFIGRVDLQYCNGFLLEDPKKDIETDRDEFLDAVADEFDDQIMSFIIGDDEDKRKCIGRNLHLFNNGSIFETKAIKRLIKITELTEQEVSQLYTEPSDWLELGNKVIGALSSLGGAKKFERTLDFALFVSSWLPKGEEIVICFDNSDRLQRDFLLELIGRLLILDQPDANRDSKLKALLYVRMSTVRDGASAFPRADIVSSASLAPISAILSRITRYLWSTERQSFYRTNEDEAKMLDANIMELMVLLSEPFSPARDMIESICGSDIRRSFKMVTNWLVDQNFTVSRFQKRAMKSVLPRNFRSTLLRLWLREYLTTWFEEFFDQCCLNEYHAETVEKYAKEHKNRINRNLQSLLNKDATGIQFLPINIEQITPADVDSLRSYLLSLQTTDDALRIRCRKEFPCKKVEGFANKLDRAFSASEDRLLLGILKALWTKSVRVTLTDDSRHEATRRVSTHANKFLADSLGGKSWRNKKSRFAVSSEMLSCAFAAKDSPHPFNLVAGNHHSEDTDPLWVLSIIYGSYIGSYAQQPVPYMTGKNLIWAMQTLGIDDARVKSALEELADQRHRLIFSSIHDEEYFKNENWVNQNFYLTRAGFNFCQKMFSNLHYIEWCLMRNNTTRQKYFIDLSPDTQKNLSATAMDVELAEAEAEAEAEADYEDHGFGAFPQVDTLTALTATMRSIVGLIKGRERLEVTKCIESEKVLPFIPCGTPLLQIGYNVFTESKSIAKHLLDTKRVDRATYDEVETEFEEFRLQLIDYVNYIEERSRRNLPNELKGLGFER